LSAPTLDRYLQGKLQIGAANDARSVLTNTQTAELVELCRLKTDLGTPEGRAWLNDQVIIILTSHALVNKGRNFKPLSANAKAAKRRGHPANWIDHFLARPDIAEKNERPLDRQRYEACTEKIVRDYGAQLEKTALLLDIAKVDPTTGKQQWDFRRVLTEDECPQPLGERGARGSGSKAITGKGQDNNRVREENRERISIDEWVCLNGKCVLHHVIDSSVGHSNMNQIDPDQKYIKGDARRRYMVSTQANAYQDGATMLSALKAVWRIMDELFELTEDLKAGDAFIWLTDGQSAFNIYCLRFCKANCMYPVLYYGHTTHACAPLDKIFAMFQKSFEEVLAEVLKLLKIHHEMEKEKSQEEQLRQLEPERAAVVAAVGAAEAATDPGDPRYEAYAGCNMALFYRELYPRALAIWWDRVDITKAAAACGVTEEGFMFDNIDKKHFAKDKAVASVAAAAVDQTNKTEEAWAKAYEDEEAGIDYSPPELGFGASVPSPPGHLLVGATDGTQKLQMKLTMTTKVVHSMQDKPTSVVAWWRS